MVFFLIPKAQCGAPWFGRFSPLFIKWLFANPKSTMWGAMVWQISMRQTKQTTLTTFLNRFFCELIFVGASRNLLGCENFLFFSFFFQS
jgi:hypothetical protein